MSSLGTVHDRSISVSPSAVAVIGAESRRQLVRRRRPAPTEYGHPAEWSPQRPVWE